jgi:hypothetical protein
VVASFLPYLIINYTSWFPLIDPLHPGLLIYAIAVIYLVVAFFIGEVVNAKIRKKTSNWYGPLNMEDRHQMRITRGPWLFAGLVGLILGVIVSYLFNVAV